MKWVSIDPGSHRMGWCLWHKTHLENHIEDIGFIKAPKKLPLWERINALCKELHWRIAGFGRDRLGVFVFEDPQTFKGQASRALHNATGALAGVGAIVADQIVGYHPSTIKAQLLPDLKPKDRTKVNAHVRVRELYPSLRDVTDSEKLDAFIVGYCHLKLKNRI